MLMRIAEITPLWFWEEVGQQTLQDFGFIMTSQYPGIMYDSNIFLCRLFGNS